MACRPNTVLCTYIHHVSHWQSKLLCKLGHDRQVQGCRTHYILICVHCGILNLSNPKARGCDELQQPCKWIGVHSCNAWRWRESLWPGHQAQWENSFCARRRWRKVVEQLGLLLLLLLKSHYIWKNPPVWHVWEGYDRRELRRAHLQIWTNERKSSIGTPGLRAESMAQIIAENDRELECFFHIGT